MTAVALDENPTLVLVRVFEKIPDSDEKKETDIPMWTFLNRNTDDIYVKGTIVPLVRRIEDLLSKSQILRYEKVEYFYSTAYSGKDDEDLVPQAVRITVDSLLTHLREVEKGLEQARKFYLSDKRSQD